MSKGDQTLGLVDAKNAVARKACEIAGRLYPGTRWLPGDAAGLEALPPAGDVEHVSLPDDLHAVSDGKVPPPARGGADEDGLDTAA